MVNIKFHTLPYQVQDQFRAVATERFRGQRFTNEFGTSVIQEILDIDVTYLDQGGPSFHGDFIQFRTKKDYTWYLLKYGSHSS